MLEKILLTIILGYAFSYIAVKAAAWWVDWDCRRSNTPEARQRWIEGLKDQSRTKYILTLGHCPANTLEGREKQFRELDTAQNRKRWQELKSRPLPAQSPAHMGSSHPC